MLYASATHPPTSRDLEPYWQVGEWRERLPPPTHLPVGKTPLVGVLPYYSVGRTQKPLSHKLTPSSLPPYSMFMTEVTSMIVRALSVTHPSAKGFLRRGESPHQIYNAGPPI